jgi:hypothetical protein
MRGLLYGLAATLPGTLLAAGAVIAVLGRRAAGLRLAGAGLGLAAATVLALFVMPG